MSEHTTKKRAIWDTKIVKRAIGDSFKKLNPRLMMKNPVMFVVEVGSVLTTIQLIRGSSRRSGRHQHGLRVADYALALVYGTLREFRGGNGGGPWKAQADNLRKAKTETTANRLVLQTASLRTMRPQLRKDDIVHGVGWRVHPR